ncbi:hypothetical protein ACFXHA_06950 [Nocardia sp. NPDC059240]|uniref:hypothetical protein n=1 Tax=Nocardia sp. NPDC059240 TaxID=3346786 RepID=UPI00368B5D44
MLIAAAVLTVAMFWLPVMTYGDGKWDAFVWKVVIHHGSTRFSDYFGVAPYVLVAISAAVAGIPLAVGVGARRGGLFWLGAFASGMALQIASQDVVGYGRGFGHGVSLGSGYWVITLVMVLGIAALATALWDAVVAKRGAVQQAGGAADRVAGVFLIVAAAVDFGATFVPAVDRTRHFTTIWSAGETAGFPWSAVRFTLGSIAVLVVAIALLAGFGVRNAAVRAASGAAAGLIAVSAVGGLGDVFSIMGPNFWEYAGAGFWLLVLTVVLSFAAAVAGVVAQVARPRLMAQPRAGQVPGFAPAPGANPFAPVGQPAMPGPNPFAAAAAAPNPFAAATPVPNPLVSGPNLMVQNPFAPAQTGPEVETTVRIEPKPGAVQPPRMAKVYDEKGADGRPVVNRPELDGNSRMAVLAYLESAPIVLAARSFDQDEFAPAERDVPLNFRTDGVWVWAGAVSHYLHKHGLTPEPELVQHIVSRGFRVGNVDEAAKDAAIKVITGG